MSSVCEAGESDHEGHGGHGENLFRGNHVSAEPEIVCDICGSTDVEEIRCKVICRNCGTILKSCADL